MLVIGGIIVIGVLTAIVIDAVTVHDLGIVVGILIAIAVASGIVIAIATAISMLLCERQECDNEGLSYYNGRGRKGWAAVGSPGEVQSASHGRCVRRDVQYAKGPGQVQFYLNMRVLPLSETRFERFKF